jgi:hypothetical protein
MLVPFFFCAIKGLLGKKNSDIIRNMIENEGRRGSGIFFEFLIKIGFHYKNVDFFVFYLIIRERNNYLFAHAKFSPHLRFL